jgi:hypothetical protein
MKRLEFPTRMPALALAVLLAAFLLAQPGTAVADTPPLHGGRLPANVLPTPDAISPTIFKPASQTVPPPTFKINARQAIAIANRVPEVVKARRHHPRLSAAAWISPLELANGRFYHWDVIYTSSKRRQVEVEMGRTGQVFEVQTYPDVGWQLLRGYPNVLGQKLNAPYVWLPLCLLFLAPFFDPRRPLRLLHLDLLMLLGFGISHFFFNLGRPDFSVPLVYPFLIYAAGRLLVAAYRPRRRAGPLMPFVSTRLLAVVVVALIAMRLTFGIFGSNTFDISAAGVVGADRIEHGLDLYVFNQTYGDTYGPLNYLVYIPAELAFPIPAHGIIDAARATTLGLDMLVILGLFLLGRSLRREPEGTRLGLALAFAWSAFPYSGLVLASNTNDALVPLFIIYALIFLRSPPARGVLAGLATMAKFAPGLVAPALVTGRGPFKLRSAATAATLFAVVCIGMVALFLPDGGVTEFWKTTMGYQLHRWTPLSIWTRTPWLDFLKPVVDVAVVALALSTAWFPRRRSVAQVAALCGAILAAAQLPGNYWLYFYIVWFAPFLFIAVFEEHRDLGPVGQLSVTSDLVNPDTISQPSSVTATRSSMRTPSTPGR